MDDNKEYVPLNKLLIYKIAVELSDLAWSLYLGFDWGAKKIEGQQFVRSIDSVGANIAEGYGRFHYLDRIKFYYNARGSLFESKHWSLILFKRNKIKKEMFDELIKKLNYLNAQLNIYIRSCYQSKQRE